MSTAVERLFEPPPRITVVHDTEQPDEVKLGFSGVVELDRDNAEQVEMYNRLRAGDEVTLAVTARVDWTAQKHHRDSEGEIDAVVHTKGMRVVEVLVHEEEL